MPNRRKTHKKSRGGCLTCKKRRVKCDETHPTCRRCIYTGWSCSWTSASVPSSIPSRIFQTQRETRYFDFFRLQTVVDLSGWSPSSFWQRLVLQMVHSEPPARRAAIALGALHVEGASCPHVLRYYGEALTTLRRLLNQSETSLDSIDVCLTTCLLLSCFEIARKDYTAANIHYSRGLEILRTFSPNLIHPQAASPATPDTPSTEPAQPAQYLPCYERSLLAHFSLLETHVISFLDNRPGYHQDPIYVEYDLSQLSIPLQFTSLPEATDSFVRLLHTVQNRAIRTSNHLAFATPDSAPNDDGTFPHRETYAASMRHGTRLRAVLRESLTGLTAWTHAFDAFLASVSGSVSGVGIGSDVPGDDLPLRHQRVVALLRGHANLLYIRCAREPTLGEMGYDAFLPQYEAAVRELERAVALAWAEKAASTPLTLTLTPIPGTATATATGTSPSPGSTSTSTSASTPRPRQQQQEGQKQRPLFSLGLGVLHASYDILAKCRDRGIRERGLAVLSRMPYQEGLWTGANARRAIGRIVEFEEMYRTPGVEGPEGIAREHRIVGVNFLFRPGRFKVIADWVDRREGGWVDLE
ncbi:Zn(II)2Cys6 transcription factor [Aspergillus lucknowensis]|uniref:Zn(2)-C6 fungal-type domain-containing protein n=1 Tax=Aspergillus lucknowensis TaxID=176173 RepID=A0ABR4LRS7_9EURO